MGFANWLYHARTLVRGARRPAVARRNHAFAHPLDFCRLEDRVMLSVTSLSFVNASGNAVSSMYAGQSIYIRAQAADMIGKTIQISVWEDDGASGDDKIVTKSVKIGADGYGTVAWATSQSTWQYKDDGSPANSFYLMYDAPTGEDDVYSGAAGTGTLTIAAGGTIRRVDSTAPIQPGVTTFVIAHGLNGNASLPWITDLAATIKSVGARMHETFQVLTLDWSYCANSTINGTTLKYAKAIGKFASDTLSSYGLTGADLNLIGHSWGAYVVDELAEKIGGVNTIVALDPGQVIPLGYSESDVNFAAHSNWSWAFHASPIYGSTTTPGTADRAFIVQATESWLGTAHNAVPVLFTRMIARTTGGVSELFSLSNLLSAADSRSANDPWSLNHYGQGGRYEAVMATVGNAGSAPASITFVDKSTSATRTISESPPVISITAVDSRATESPAATDTGKIRISRSGGSTSTALTINYTVSGTATSGSDYSAISSSVTIPAGKSYVDVVITPVDDTLAEPSETLTLTLASSANYRLNTKVSAQSATVTLVDNEPIISIVRGRNASETKPDTTGQGYFVVSRTGDLTKDVTISFTLSGTATSDDDYTAPTGTITLLAGQKSAKLFITPVNDNIVETSETLIVTLASGANYHLHSKTSLQTTTLTIADNEPTVTLVASDRSARESLDGKQTASFVVTRSTADITQPLVVFYAVGGTATAGSDYTALTGSITIAACAKSATILISPVDDAEKEPTETVILTLAPSVTYRGKAVAQSISILDWEPLIA